MKQLSSIEWTTLWMAIRYAMNRETISSATLPELIIENYYNRLSDNQKKSIVNDLRNNYKDFGNTAFGNKLVDKPIWLKFWYALDSKYHYDVKLIDGSIVTVFDCLDRVIPLSSYLENPNKMIFIPEENILEIINKNEI